MNFVKVKATGSNTVLGEYISDAHFHLNTDLIKIISGEDSIVLKDDEYNVKDNCLISGDMEFKSIVISEEVNLDKPTL